MDFFSLDYPITRNYKQSWLGPVSFGGAFIAIVLLAVLNAALVGYETITVFQSDPNITQKFWYDRFMPYRKPKPGSLCAPHVFNVGDTFTTENAIFAWSMQSIEKVSAGASGVTYNGSVLKNCDVAGVYLTGDLRVWTLDYSVLISCRSGDGVFDVSATTSFSISSLPGTLAPLLGYQRAVNAQSDIGNSRAIILDRVIRSATEDFGERAFVAFSTNSSNPVVISLQADFEFCPASSGGSSCAKSSPKFNITDVATVSSTGNLVQNSNNEDGISILGKLFEAPVFNILQTIYAAVRIDLGIDSPNNYLLHKDVMNQTLNATFPVTPSSPANPDNKGLVSHLYNVWENPNAPESSGDYSWMSKLLPLNVTGPASLQVVYLCQFQSLKSIGSLIVSVLVATLSMFSSGWGIYMVFLGMVAKRDRDANQCEGHLADNEASQGYYQGVTNNSEPKYTMPVPMK